MVGLGQYHRPHPLGNINQFQIISYPPKISDLSRHEERIVMALLPRYINFFMVSRTVS